MDKSESTAGVLPALLAATQEIGHSIAKTNVAQAGKKNYRFADLASLLEMVCPVLARHGLLLVSSQETHDVVVTRCYHVATGEFVSSLSYVPYEGEQAKEYGPKGAQAAGSAYTYGRRYSIMALLCIAGEDDDGAATRPAAKSAPASSKSAPTFSPAEIEYAIKQGWEAPAGWPAASQARYRADIDSGAVVIS
jgi:hypothetical protein